MTRDDPARSVGHPNLYLAGDFQSPAQVLAADALTDEQKREILEVWHRDLMNRGGRSEHEELLADIEQLLVRLGGSVPDDNGRG